MSATSSLVTLHKKGSKRKGSLSEDYVVSGAVVYCSRGTADAKITFPSRGYNMGYGETGLDIDTSFSTNFSGTFGFCKVTDEPCSPLFVSRWMESEQGQLVNGGHPILGKSMLVCKRGGTIHFRNNGQDLETLPRGFVLPAEYREKISAIIASGYTWNKKANLIGNVYENYLYSLHKQDFDAFSRAFRRYARGSEELLKAERKLGIALQNSGTDIKAVARAMGDDMLLVVPKNNSFLNQLLSFADLVKPNAPADLKARPLSKSIGKAGYDFSTWSRQWEPDMRSDYLGNYVYGYNGAAYFKNFDFENIFPADPLVKTPWGDIGEKNLLARTALEVLRASNPDKTDAEMLLLISAGGAQVIDDKDIYKYITSLLGGSWGDNEIDSEFASEGINDYYSSKCIEKGEKTREERR